MEEINCAAVLELFIFCELNLKYNSRLIIWIEVQIRVQWNQLDALSIQFIKN
jgi:hypothetical protein